MTHAVRCSNCGRLLAGDRVGGACPWCVGLSALEASRTAVSSGPARPLPAEAAQVGPEGRFGKFICTRKLGAGAMGEVWKAWDTELERWVALKFLKGSREDSARFRREAQVAGNLAHPNIAAIHEVGEDQGRAYIAMQYIEGKTLDDYPRRDRGTLARLICGAARAVDFAHRQGIVHRDLKPSNLMAVDRGDGEYHVYVMDFGLARPVEGVEKLTASGAVVGTPAYLPPEQARGEMPDRRADVYGLGATLYELLTGEVPFTGKSVYEVLKRVEEEDPKAPRKIDRTIDRDLETIVLKCLSKDPAKRYASARALGDDLERYLEREPIQARPSTFTYRLRKKLAKRKAMAAAGLSALAVIALVAWWARVIRPEQEYLRDYGAGMNLWDEVRRASVGAVQPEKARGKAREARKLFESALAWATRADAQLMRGRCLQVEGNGTEAQESFRRARALHPSHSQARLELAKALLLQYQALRGLPPIVYVDDSVNFGPLHRETREEEGLREEARTLLAGVAEGPALGDLLRGLSAMRGGRYKEALTHLERYSKEEGDAHVMWLEGVCRYYDRDFAGAEKQFETLLIWKLSSEGYYFRGLARAAQKKYGEAIQDYDMALSIDAKLADAANSRGLARVELKDPEGAVRDFTDALKINPQYALALTNRGIVRANLREFKEAIGDFDKAIGIDRQQILAFANRGLVRAALKEFEGAIKDFDQALNLDPHRPKILTNRGAARMELKRYEEAFQDFDKAIEMDPTDALAYANRGLAREGLKDNKAAIRDYNAALGLKRYPGAFWNRALARQKLGDNAGALADLRRALEAAPPDWRNRPSVEARIRRIEDLQAREAGLSEEQRLFARSLMQLIDQNLVEAIEGFKMVAEALPRIEVGWKSAYNLACAHALRGEKSNALDWLEKAVENGYADVAQTEKDADLDSLRQDERYKKLVEVLRRP